MMGVDSFSEALSCPTFEEGTGEGEGIGEGSGGSYVNLPSEQMITNSREMERIMELEREVVESRREQERMKEMIKQQNQRI